MVEVEELLGEATPRMPSAAEVRARGSRRRARRRVAAVTSVAAVAAAGVFWAAGPGQEQGRVHTAAPPAPVNPYRVDGVIRTLPADEVPLFGPYHWKKRTGDDSSDQVLTRLGFDNACMYTPVPPAGPADQVRYSSSYTGTGGARARHRIAEYDDAAGARGEFAALQDALKGCGLSPLPAAEQAGTLYAGRSRGGPWLRVFVAHGLTWTSVVEVQEPAKRP